MNQNFLSHVVFCLFCLAQLNFAQGIIKDDFLVNDDASSAHQNYPSISLDMTGNFIIVWQDSRNGNGDIYYQRYNSSGSLLGVNNLVNNDTGSAYQGYNSIAMDGAGNYVIVWDDKRNTNYDTDIYFQRFTSTGTTLGLNTKVNDDVDSVQQWDPAIAMNVTGGFVVVWADERNGNRDIYFQRFTSTGASLGTNIKVNDDATNADQISPSISMDVAGNFIITWQDFRNANWDIYLQRYTDTGTPLGNNIQVNDDTGNDFQYYPSISMDGTGDFVIAWQDFRNSNWDIYFQRFTNSGTTLGNNTKVNDDAGNAYQKVPSISVNTVGDFVIVWMDYRYGQTNSDIFGQRFFSTGYPNGGNYRIVSDGPNYGESSPVAYADNSSIIFSWEDNRRSLGWDIYSKIVNWNWNGVTTTIDEGINYATEFSLSQNYPNPFNPSTRILYRVSNISQVTLKVYDVLGKEIATLVDEEKPAGSYEVEFNGNGLKSGMYFYQLKAREYIKTRKMVFIK